MFVPFFCCYEIEHVTIGYMKKHQASLGGLTRQIQLSMRDYKGSEQSFYTESGAKKSLDISFHSPTLKL